MNSSVSIHTTVLTFGSRNNEIVFDKGDMRQYKSLTTTGSHLRFKTSYLYDGIRHVDEIVGSRTNHFLIIICK